MSTERNELADEMTGWTVSSGYYGQELGSEVAQEIAEHLIKAGYRKPRITGYLVVDTVSRKLDWDGELHPTYEAAIESLTGPYQQWCKTVEEETEDRTYWGTAYTICPVHEGDPNV